MQKESQFPSLIVSIDDQTVLPWDIEIDVLVVGAGGCGLVAALAAAETGVDVLVVEKGKSAGGNTARSQAMVPAAGTLAQLAAGISDTPEMMLADILKKNQHGSHPELTRHIAQQSAFFIDWLHRRTGIELELVTDFLYPGHSVHRIHANKSRNGQHLVLGLLQAAEQDSHISIAYNSPATRLIADAKTGAVLGAEVCIAGGERNLARAQRTILALNGFGANRTMLDRFIPEMSSAYYFGHEGNTGEGILWGEALGAQLEHMNAYQAHGSVTHPHGTLLTWAVISLGGFQVNLAGKRFVNEYHGYSEHALDILSQEEGVAVEIFDQRIYDAVEKFEDFQLCVEMGAIKKFDDIHSLATWFKLPPHNLVASYDTFQEAACGERADTFGRTDFGPPLMPPLYGVRVTGALFHTQGGLSVDNESRVLRPDGSWIANLYAGGGTAAGFSGKAGPAGYLSANGLMAALILGMIAGRQAGNSLQPLTG